MSLTLPPELMALIHRRESLVEDFDEEDFSFQLENQLKALTELPESEKKAGFAEVAAFQFRLSRHQGKSPWGTRFEPFIDASVNDRQIYDPDIKQIDSEILAHWTTRATECLHPVMKARYADLLWDLTEAATGDKRPFQLARLAVEQYTECGTTFPASGTAEVRLARAFEIAMLINFKEGADAAQAAIFSLLWHSAERPDRNHWLFDLIHSDLGLTPTPEQMLTVLTGLEAELERICSAEYPCGLTARLPAMRLAAYYEKNKEPEEAKRVIRRYGGAVMSMAEIAQQFVSVFWLQDLYGVYLHYGLKDETDPIQRLMKEKTIEGHGQLVEQTVRVEWTAEEMDQFIASFFGHGDLDDTLVIIADHFVPKQADLKQRIEEFKKMAPTFAMMQVTNVTEDQIVSEIGSMESDPEGHMMAEMSRDVCFRAVFLRAVLARAQTQFSYGTKDLLDIFFKSEVFDSLRTLSYEQGIDAYLVGDHVKAIHVLIPEIEHCFRRVLAIVLKKATTKHSRSNLKIMLEKSLNDMLEQEPAMTLFLGEDYSWFLRMFLCDPRGMNVRNNVAHGIWGPDRFTIKVSDRLLQILILLASIRPRVTDK